MIATTGDKNPVLANPKSLQKSETLNRSINSQAYINNNITMFIYTTYRALNFQYHPVLICDGFEKTWLPRTIINNGNTKFNYSFRSISGRHGAACMKLQNFYQSHEWLNRPCQGSFLAVNPTKCCQFNS